MISCIEIWEKMVMNERVVEILIYLMTEIHENQEGMEQIDGISNDLKQQGYTENEINTAFSWLFERIKSDTEQIFKYEKNIKVNSFRALHDIEKIVITPKAYGYILQLQHLNLLDGSDVEQVIERAMMLGSSLVNIDDIKSIVASIFFNSDNPGHNFLGKSILDTDGMIH